MTVKEKIKNYLQLLRVRQWYKNLVIFLAIFFGGKLFDFSTLSLAFFGFMALCLFSSGNYIFNDLIDLKRDQFHPEKRTRPLASGKISKLSALILGLFCIGSSLLLSFYLQKEFFYLILVLLILSQLYSFFLKNIVFADILAISSLFVIRSISGAILTKIRISPWLVLCPFFLAMFLAVGKRYADINLLKEKAFETRKVLQDYSPKLLENLMIISTTLLVISYALYSFLSVHPLILITLPVALFIIFRIFYLFQEGSIIAQHPEKMITDISLVVGSLLLFLLMIIVIYVPLPFVFSVM